MIILGWMLVSSLKIHMLKPNPHGDGVRRGGLEEVMRS